MTLCRFSESNSNLNYKCVIVCSEFFQKIILRYKSSDYFIELSIVLKNTTSFNECVARKSKLFFFKKFKGNKENIKKEILQHEVLSCVLKMYK